MRTQRNQSTQSAVKSTSRHARPRLLSASMPVAKDAFSASAAGKREPVNAEAIHDETGTSHAKRTSVERRARTEDRDPAACGCAPLFSRRSRVISCLGGCEGSFNDCRFDVDCIGVAATCKPPNCPNRAPRSPPPSEGPAGLHTKNFSLFTSCRPWRACPSRSAT